MPVYRFSKAVKLARGAKAFVDIKLGVTRGAASENLAQGTHARQQRMKDQRQLLAKKEREITRLKMQISAIGGHPGESSPARQTASRGSGEPPYGGLPDFLIIGAQKAGTTLLYHLLSQHPHVEPATTKEVHYFDVHFDKGDEWYRSHFPRPSSIEGRKILTGEASPYYLYHPLAAKRAASTVPHVKAIALLRNPVDRAYSDHQHKVREGRESLSFERALDMEETRLRGERERMLADESYSSPNYRKYSYLSRGVYVDQLKEWRKYFGADQMLVLKSEDFFERPSDALKTVFGFLELPDRELEKQILGGSQDARHQGSYEPMDPAIRRRLETYFEPHNQRLYEYLGVSFDW